MKNKYVQSRRHSAHSAFTQHRLPQIQMNTRSTDPNAKNGEWAVKFSYYISLICSPRTNVLNHNQFREIIPKIYVLLIHAYMNIYLGWIFTFLPQLQRDINNLRYRSAKFWFLMFFYVVRIFASDALYIPNVVYRYTTSLYVFEENKQSIHATRRKKLITRGREKYAHIFFKYALFNSSPNMRIYAFIFFAPPPPTTLLISYDQCIGRI